jgi:hypothetical protein
MTDFKASMASSFVVGMRTPLPAARPDALMTHLPDGKGLEEM